MQSIQDSVESGEEGILMETECLKASIPGSLYLPLRFMRDSMKLKKLNKKILKKL